MATKRAAVYVKCPFYHTEHGIKITCDGLVEGGYINLIYPTADSRVEYEAKYCKRNWKMCPLAKMLEKVYEDDFRR